MCKIAAAVKSLLPSLDFTDIKVQETGITITLALHDADFFVCFLVLNPIKIKDGDWHIPFFPGKDLPQN